MGGTRDPIASSASNLLVLCGSGTEGCHGWVESNRAESYDLGLLVRAGVDPRTVPATLHYGTVFLDDEGGVQTC